MKEAPTVLNLHPINGWTLGMVLVLSLWAYVMWRWLKPNPASVKLFCFQLVNSPDTRGRERGDLRKVGAAGFMLLSIFIVIRGALFGGTDPGVLAQLLSFVAVLLAIGIPVAFSKSAAEAVAIKAEADLTPKPTQEVKVVNDEENPVPTTNTPTE